MKTIQLFSIIGLVALMLFACKKKEEPQPDNSASTFSLSLSASPTTISTGGESIITTSVSGANGTVTYNWSVNTSSTIQGSGNEVRLWASCPSCTGPNKVTCIAKDANNVSVTKEITITVTN